MTTIHGKNNVGPDSRLERLVDEALWEDLQNIGDRTSSFLLPETLDAAAEIVAKQPGIISGLEVAERVFQRVDAKLVWETRLSDGCKVRDRDVIARVSGPAVSILSSERTALNFLQRLSGIATLTARYVEAVRGTAAKILDTRKTTPGWRFLEKAAVRAGGGYNHRYGLFDMILLKENHIRAAGGIFQAVSQIRNRMQQNNVHLELEVEVRDLQEVQETVRLDVQRIMLDNMPLKDMKQAVKLVGGRVPLEASGGVTLSTVRQIAETGVDFISVGALTHSAPALDLSLLFL